MRDWWARQSPETKRAYIDSRAPQPKRSGRRPKPRDPEKKRAQRAVYKALQRGTLVKLPCGVCGAEKVDAHHDDYAKPLSVRWLCRRHHGLEHRIYRADEGAGRPEQDLSAAAGASSGDGQELQSTITIGKD